jgi:AraC-like DNA-binding protein
MNWTAESMEQKLHGGAATTPKVARSVVRETERYSRAVAGIELDAVRGGAGTGVSDVITATCSDFSFTSSQIGFPMLAMTALSDDLIGLAVMKRTVVGNRWCEMSLAAGDVVTYAPSAEHTARHFPGTEFMFMIAEVAMFEERSEELGVRLAPMPRGRVSLLPQSTKSCLVGQALDTFGRHAESGHAPALAIADGVMSATVLALSEQGRKHCIGASSRIDSRHVVHTCIDYANSIQRIPSVSELCIVAHVSERTLRGAFTREYDLPPTQYFRAWALDQAHRHLTKPDDSTETVTTIATGLGFDHLGRFAGRYKQIYGEAPSATLHPERCVSPSGSGAAH